MFIKFSILSKTNDYPSFPFKSVWFVIGCLEAANPGILLVSLHFLAIEMDNWR